MNTPKHALSHRPTSSVKRIAILGGGLAGLTAAYELQKLAIRDHIRLEITLIERLPSLGGQIETCQLANSNLHYEAGAELISSTHESLINLCRELNLTLEPFNKQKSANHSLFHINGTVYDQKDFEAAFAPLARAIAEDEARILRRQELKHDQPTRIEWNYAEADQIDDMSLREYLKKKQRHLRGQKIAVPDWVIEAVCVAYGGEIGHNAKQISALNFVLMLDSAQIRSGNTVSAEMPGEADEILHINGGNSRLIETLRHKISDLSSLVPCQIECETTAQTIDHIYRRSGLRPFAIRANSLRLSPSPAYDGIISCLPPKRLADIEGWDDVIYAGGKHIHTANLIDEMQEGVLTKVAIPLRHAASAFSDINDGQDFSGIIYSDTCLQTMWLSPQSMASESGVLTCYIAGKTKQSNGELALKCKQEFLSLVNQQRIKKQLPLLSDGDVFLPLKPAVSHWDKNSRDPFVAPAKAQFLDLQHITPHHRNFSIAGSFIPHTVITQFPDGQPDYDIQVGYMNNAVASAKASAQSVFNSIVSARTR